VIDDWAVAPLSEPERRDFWETGEDRSRCAAIRCARTDETRMHKDIRAGRALSVDKVWPLPPEADFRKYT